jgi:hypothetical protein
MSISHASTIELATAQHALLATLGVIVATHALVEGLLLGAVAVTGQLSAMRAKAKED